MIKLINILKEITEGKQVGTLYHYTFTWNLYKIIKTNILTPELLQGQNKGWISFTRSKDKNQFEISQDANCVIVVDGDKLSNKYKIKPFQDLGFISSGGVGDEMEERVLGPINDLNKYIIKIIIYITSYNDQSDNQWVSKNILQTEELLKEKNIPYEIIKL
jgi:hypothetical protein